MFQKSRKASKVPVSCCQNESEKLNAAPQDVSKGGQSKQSVVSKMLHDLKLVTETHCEIKNPATVANVVCAF